MKHLHDNGTQPDRELHSQLVLQARQQLGMDSQLASPQLATPAQILSGLPQMASKPGLGYAPVTELEGLSAAAPSQHMMAVPQSVQTPQSTAADMQPLQQQTQQSHSEQPIKGPEVGSASGTSVIATKHWQGPLYVISHKGEELVCNLSTDAWPSDLSR